MVDGAGELWRGEGEVSERAELLNGSLQLSIEGAVGVDGGAPWELSASFAWQLGRDGDVPLTEGDLALEGRDGELFATLGDGVATVDPDSGAATVRATFIIDGVEGERLIDLGLRPDDAVSAELTVEAERWRGELRLPGSAEDSA